MGGRIDEGMPRMANERLPERSIPDRSPGHAFVRMTKRPAGCCLGRGQAPSATFSPHIGRRRYESLFEVSAGTILNSNCSTTGLARSVSHMD